MLTQLSLKKSILSGFFLFSIGITLANSHEQRSFKVLTPKYIKKLLGPYPAKGSIEEAQDFETLLKYQEARTDEECAMASHNEKGTLKNLFVIPNGPLTKKEALRLSPVVLKLYAEAGINIYIAKNVYKRPRPYITNAEIQPCISLENSYAYPSGHTTMARVFGRILAHIFPERAEVFMKRADEVAASRVLGGVHHPTDIEAGKKLGDIIAKKILKTLIVPENM